MNPHLLFPISNLILLLGVVGYAWRRGGWEERLCGLGLFVDSVATGIVVRYFQLTHPQNGWLLAAPYILLIDSLLLVILLGIALRSARFWPLWVAALQIPGVVTHIAYMVDDRVVPYGYAIAQTLWIYPMYVALILGTRRHYARRMLMKVA